MVLYRREADAGDERKQQHRGGQPESLGSCSKDLELQIENLPDQKDADDRLNEAKCKRFIRHEICHGSGEISL